MAIQYDNLNAAYSMLRTLREEFLKGTITKDELDAQEFIIKNDIRKILGLREITPP